MKTLVAGATDGRVAKAAPPLRLLMGVPSAGATDGGPALHVPMLVEDLERDGRVRVVSLPYGRWAEGEPALLKVLHQGVDLLLYPWRLRRSHADLVHLNTCLDRRALLRDNAFVTCSRWLGKPVFLKWHGSQIDLLEPGSSGLWRFLARRLLRQVHTLGVLSSVERQQVLAFSPGVRCEVVHNPIDSGRYQRSDDLSRWHTLPPGSLKVLFISRLIAGKGLLDTVRAVAALDDTRLQLLVVGDGPRRQAGEELAEELGIADQVHFVGRVSEERAAVYYAGCDALVFPSTLTEGFPMTLFQSVVAGMGIVTTRLRAALDHLQEDRHCLYVEPRDPQGVARALQRLLEEPRLLASMRVANRELAARFARQTVASNYERIYNEMRSTPEGS